MKPLIAAIIAFAICAIYPPWNPTGRWKVVATGELADPVISRALDRKCFAVLPFSYSWIWHPPKYDVESSGLETNLVPGSEETYVIMPWEITTRVYTGFLIFQGTILALAAAVFTSGILRLSFSSRDLFKVALVGTVLLTNGWIAFVGFYVNLIRIRSGLFSVSVLAFFMFLLGVIGIGASISLLRFPRPAAIFAMLSTLSLAGMGILSFIVNKDPTESFLVRSLQIGFLILLVLAVYVMFFRNHDSSVDQTGTHEQ